MAGAEPLILFAHGAGAPSASGWMRAWAGRLGTLGTVATFDYPYMKAGRKSPDKQPALIAAHAAALEEARARHGGERPVVLAGKSMGSRIGCHLAVERGGAGVSALVCFGYPLRAGGTGALRDEVLRALRTPVLFLQGSKDPLCPLDGLARVRAQMTAPSELFVVEGGNHSLEVGVRDLRAAGKTQEDWNQAVLAAVGRFLDAHAHGGTAV
jgi:predicted alpha/beta-hydrolase family hydrolase